MYDQSARYLVRQRPAGFLAWAVGELMTDFEFVEWADAQTSPPAGEQQRLPDMVARFVSLKDAGDTRLLNFEFQSRPDSAILIRAARYAARKFAEEPAAGVHPVVFNMTGPPQPAALGLNEPKLAGAGVVIRADVRTLREMDAASLLTDIEAGAIDRCVLPWLALMKGADTEEFVRRWRQATALENDPHMRGVIAGTALIFASLAVRHTLWSRVMKNFDVEVPPIVQEWADQARAEGRVEGRVEGRAEGRAEGEAIGEANGVRAVLKRELAKRLTAPLPPELLARIDAQSDQSVLLSWIDLAQEVTSVEEFLQKI